MLRRTDCCGTFQNGPLFPPLLEAHGNFSPIFFVEPGQVPRGKSHIIVETSQLGPLGYLTLRLVCNEPPAIHQAHFRSLWMFLSQVSALVPHDFLVPAHLSPQAWGGNVPCVPASPMDPRRVVDFQSVQLLTCC